MKEQVLFVDDDPGLLSGLKRMLRSMRDSWDITFASTGKEALHAMTMTCFDVVVTDMRMPELSGGELLAEVKKICPRSVRIILSGQADLELIMTAIGPTHQYLSKPCDAEILKTVITKACNLRKLLTPLDLKEMTSQITNIPVQPSAHEKVIAELSKENPSFSILSETISADIGMTAHILQLVNSAFFGTQREIKSISQAVGLVGLKLLKDIVVTKKLFETNSHNFPLLPWLEEINNHSRVVAENAAVIASVDQDKSSMPDEFYTAGLLHDIGKLIFAQAYPERYMEVLAASREHNTDLEALEIEQFGASHTQVGGYLLGLWGLPDNIVEAVAQHHRVDESAFGIISTVHVANALAARATLGESWAKKLNLDHIRTLNMEGKIQEWLTL